MVYFLKEYFGRWLFDNCITVLILGAPASGKFFVRQQDVRHFH
jgi:hypothetical protein